VNVDLKLTCTTATAQKIMNYVEHELEFRPGEMKIVPVDKEYDVPTWLCVLAVAFMLYTFTARYCDFKESMGWDTTQCSLRCKER
jgi:hypothetical protein